MTFQTGLESLTLSHNNLFSLRRESLFGLESLLTLRLDHNRLFELATNFTMYCGKLVYLGTQWNNKQEHHFL